MAATPEVRETPLPLPVPPGADGEASLQLLEVGPEDADRVAIVLHGGPGASMDYLRPQLDELGSPERALLYYDQRGGGRSLTPHSWPAAGLETHLEDLDRVVAYARTRSPHKPALVGYSWGGLLALSYALEHPERVDRLLLIAPAPAWAEARKAIAPAMKAAAARPDAQAVLASLDKTSRRDRFSAAVIGYFFDPSRVRELTPFVSRERAERAAWESLAGYDLRPRLPSLAVPTLVCHGVEDPIPVSASRELARLSGATLVTFERCGHCPFIEAASDFFPLARRFLSEA